MLMGQIAQNRCYLLVRFNSAEIDLERKRFFFSFFVWRKIKKIINKI